MLRIIIWLAFSFLSANTQPLLAGQLTLAAPGGIPHAQRQVTMDAMPLLIAHQSLLLARSRVLEHRYGEAADALLAAAQSLQAFEQEEPGPRGLDAAYTLQRIRQYSQLISTDHSDAISRIDNWMDRIRHWDGGK